MHDGCVVSLKVISMHPPRIYVYILLYNLGDHLYTASILTLSLSTQIPKESSEIELSLSHYQWMKKQFLEDSFLYPSFSCLIILYTHLHKQLLVFKLLLPRFLSVQFGSVAQLCCDPMNHSSPGLPVHYQLPGFTQTHVHGVGDAIQPSHPLLSPSPPAPNPSQHQSLFQ